MGAFTAPPTQLPRRALAAVNGAAGLAFANGVWRARRLHDQSDTPAPVATAWHLMPVGTVLDHLRHHPGRPGQRRGAAPAPRRRRQRRRRHPDSGGLLRAFVDELSNPLTPVLAAGAVLSASFGSLVDAALVGGVVGGSALIGAVHERNTERSLAELLSRSAVTARVRRDGAEQVLAAEDLVLGDVIALEPGRRRCPPTAGCSRPVGLEADESSLTGESLPVAKTNRPVVAAAIADRHSMLYEGTTVAAGHGTAVVVATGDGHRGRPQPGAGPAGTRRPAGWRPGSAR